MGHQSLAANAPEFWEDMQPGIPFMYRRHRDALERLATAFDKREPLAMLVGEEKAETSQVLRCFMAGIGEDVSVARIGKPCERAREGLGELVRSIGFEPKDLGTPDLEHILRMFLSFQKGRQHRTIFGIEEAQDQGAWLIDCVRRLVEFEEENGTGLMIVLSGRPSINELVEESPLASIRDKAGQRIALEPFTLGETREYIRRRVESDLSGDVGDVFDFEAVTLIHELCLGAPDKVGPLYDKCIELAKRQNAMPVTTGVVMEADRWLKAPSAGTKEAPVNGAVNGAVKGAVNGSGGMAAKEDSGIEVVEKEVGIDVVEDDLGDVARLVVCHRNEIPHDVPLDRGRVLLGRAAICDVRLMDDLVSRHHALIVKSSQGVRLLDLGSTNGTVIDGHKVRDHALEDGQLIKIGRYRIEYRAAKDV